MNYFNYLKASFSSLKLNNEFNLNDKRTSHPIELFFDLVFVVVLGKVGHVFLHPHPQDIIIGIILFLSVYQIWNNITKFNVYFFKPGLLISFLFLILMIPVFLISGLNNYQSMQNIYILIITLGISRISLTFAWYKFIYKNKNITNLYAKKVAYKNIIIFLISTIVLFLSVFNYKLFYLFLLITIIFEIVFSSIIPIKISGKYKYSKPFIDEKLLLERRTLFVILVWGEALVTAGSLISEYNNLLQALLMSLSLFFIIGLFFLRAIMSFGDIITTEELNPVIIDFTDYTFPLITLSLFISMAGISIVQEIPSISKIIVIFDLLYINIYHLMGNIVVAKQNSSNENLQYFFKIDNQLLIIQIIITVMLLFVQSPAVFIYLNLLIFILHFLAIPIRYGKTEHF